MNTFLFIWNPKKWTWKNLDENIEILRNAGYVSETWSCISHKKIKVGDRAFLLRLGKKPKGIIGSGFVASPPFLDKHWSGENKLIYKVIIDFDVLINAEKERCLDLDTLAQGNLAQQKWISQASGISIKPDLTSELENVWFSFLKKQKVCDFLVIGDVKKIPFKNKSFDIILATEIIEHVTKNDGYSIINQKFSVQISILEKNRLSVEQKVPARFFLRV